MVRWEYRPGSILFFVWQQRRSYQDLEANTFPLAREALDLLTELPANVFIIKGELLAVLVAASQAIRGSGSGGRNSGTWHRLRHSRAPARVPCREAIDTDRRRYCRRRTP